MDVRVRWRSRTNYDSPKLDGYAPLHFAAVLDIGRLTAGKATQIMYVLWAATLGEHKKGAGYHETSPEITTAEIAKLSTCDERTVQRELADLKRRLVIEWEQPKKGINVVKLLFRSWVSLPDYQPGPLVEPKAEEIAVDETLEQAEERQASRTVLTRKPVFGSAGKPTKPIKVECGVESLQFQSDLDAKWSAVVQGGVLLVSLEKWESRSGVKGLVGNKGDTGKDPTRVSHLGKSISNAETVAFGSRTGRTVERDTESAANRGPALDARRRTGSPAVEHPRAEELTKLFDPLLLRFHKTLSGDSQSLQLACEAITKVHHDFLVKAVIERAARPIQSPRAAVKICEEVAHNWEKLQARQRKTAGSVMKCECCKKADAAVNGMCYGCAEKELSA